MSWIEQQRAVFTVWTNQTLTTKGFRPISADLASAFQTGVKLSELYTSLTGGRVRVRRSSHAAVCRANLQEVRIKL